MSCTHIFLVLVWRCKMEKQRHRTNSKLQRGSGYHTVKILLSERQDAHVTLHPSAPECTISALKSNVNNKTLVNSVSRAASSLD